MYLEYKYRYISLLVLAILWQDVSSRRNQTRTAEHRLKSEWPKDYATDVRPVRDESHAVQVQFGVAFFSIVEVNTKEETFSVSLSFRQSWRDEYLAWDPEKYDGLNITNLSTQNIWRPDIVLENNADRGKGNENIDSLTHRKAIISSEGDIKWLTSAIVIAECAMDIKHFPFDTQTCELRFVSWTFDVFAINVTAESPDVDLLPYSPHSEWLLVAAKQRHIERYYTCCKHPYSVISIEVVLKRRSLFHIIHLIAPMLLVAILGLLLFTVPARSGERVTFGVTVLLAMALFMLPLAEMIPAKADSLSKLGIFFNILIVEMGVMIFVMCYVARIYNKSLSNQPIPHWMRVHILDNLSYKLFVRKRKNKDHIETWALEAVVKENGNALDKVEKKNDKDPELKFCDFSTQGLGEAKSPLTRFQKIGDSVIYNETVIGKTDESHFSFRSVATSVTQLLRRKNDLLVAQRDEERWKKRFFYEWTVCAMTLDRLSLISFTFMVLLTCLAIFVDF